MTRRFRVIEGGLVEGHEGIAAEGEEARTPPAGASAEARYADVVAGALRRRRAAEPRGATGPAPRLQAPARGRTIPAENLVGIGADAPEAGTVRRAAH